ncbi:COMM domain-containing protein 8-like isoform X2 [Dermacentor albipictus]|uniref:COMM domain-containing protein 8-like isoform X2 n=1 Tax=Dermacentor albipictus TaxID=60249 RepID=UPI0031FCB3B8
MAAATNTPWLSLLSKFPAERAEKYLDCIVSSLCGQQRGPSFHHCSQVWSLTEFWQSTSAWRDFFGRLDPDECTFNSEHGSPVQRPLSVKKSVHKSFGGLLNVLPATHQAVVRKVTQSRREDIRHQLLHKTDDIGARALTDLDWSVKLVLGSDTVPSLGRLPLAYLSLFMGNDTVCIEVSVAEVGRLIASLEAAHKVSMCPCSSARVRHLFHATA